MHWNEECEELGLWLDKVLEKVRIGMEIRVGIAKVGVRIRVRESWVVFGIRVGVKFWFRNQNGLRSVTVGKVGSDVKNSVRLRIVVGFAISIGKS